MKKNLFYLLFPCTLLAYQLPTGVNLGQGPMPTPKPYNFERALIKNEAKLQKLIQEGKKYSLIEVYNLALSYDFKLKASKMDVEAARSTDNLSISNLLPSIGARAGYNGDVYRQVGRKKNESYYNYGLTISQQIFRPQLWIEKSQSALMLTNSKYEYENIKQQLAKRVSKAYFGYVFAKQDLLLARSYEKANKARLDELLNKKQAGNLVSKMDVLEARMRYDESVIGVSNAVRELDISRLMLANLVGKNVQVSDWIRYGNLSFFKDKDLAKYYNYAANLSFKQARINSKIAAKESLKAKMEYLPKINLNASYETSIYTKRSLRGEDLRDEAIIELSFEMPIFTSGRNYNAAQAAKYAKQASLAREEDTKNNVLLEQKQAISDFKNYIQKFRISQRAVDHALIYQEAIEEGYKKGLKDLVDLLDAKARVHWTKLNYIKSANSLIATYLQLESLVGGIDEKTIRNLDAQVVLIR